MSFQSYETLTSSSNAFQAYQNMESIQESSGYSFENAVSSSFSNGISGTNNVNSHLTGHTTNQVASDLLALVRNKDSNSHHNYISEIEQSILRSQAPININESEEITVLGHRGIWANKEEVTNWRGTIPISEYAINEDQTPEIITKRSQQQLEYIQELAIRYLRPPTPPTPGEIIIQQQANIVTPPAPPLIIRQQPARPSTPEPLVIREAPPQPPVQVGRKVITISGKRLPPPPRKVIIERLAPLPSKPQSIIIERWLPYTDVKRKVIFNKSNQLDPVVVKPRNVIVQWEAPQVQIKKELKYLGVIRANPAEYVQRYSHSLKTARELPDFVLDIKTPQGMVLAADYQYNNVHELEGEIGALRLIDLDREGLSQYKSQLEKFGMSLGAAGSSSTGGGSSWQIHSTGQSHLLSVVSDIFAQIDRDGNGSLSYDEAEKLLLKLNSRLGRRYGEEDVKKFFRSLDTNMDGFISLNEFKKAFESLL
ncbi:unnamed protein product [Brachionus calyciflorus]|uniref:EF-hand domain-containing protein n=1 Tax=Brachionus calyciflorus TaxID=104777 RepID=A0A813NSJ8_9BILA|nr:unnamed protein product [Brachionus calyciflorus]